MISSEKRGEPTETYAREWKFEIQVFMTGVTSTFMPKSGLYAKCVEAFRIHSRMVVPEIHAFNSIVVLCLRPQQQLFETMVPFLLQQRNGEDQADRK